MADQNIGDASPTAYQNGWREHARLVMATLDSHTAELTALRREQTEFRIAMERHLGEIRGEQKTQRLKAGMWGAVAGAVPAILAVVLIFAKFASN